MKVFLPILIFFTFIACKNDSKKSEIETEINSEEIVDSLRVSDRNLETQQQTLNIKRQELLEKKDAKVEMEKLLISKSFLKESDLYTLIWKYPDLHETRQPQFETFNEYMNRHYVDAKRIEKQILGEKRLCDTVGIPKQSDLRMVDYKIYNLNARLISVLFYKE